MDILLAHGYFLSLDAAEQRVMRPHPPLGLLYLSSHLKRKGIRVGVFDATFRTIDGFADTLERERPPLVGIAVNLMTKRNALRMIAMAKRRGAKVIIGGPDPPHHADAYLAAGADVVVIGEGEQTLEELIATMHSRASARGSSKHVADSDLSKIHGIVFKAADGSIVRTPPRALLPDLDAQPYPDRDAIDLHSYLNAWRERHGVGTVSLITARGCPYTCTWCSRSVFGETHRRRSVSNVADEVEGIVDRYDPERLWYADDVFAIHHHWTISYAKELERRKIRLPFECISRAERIDDDVAAALASLGCFRVWIGSESGSQRILDAMKRKVSVDQVQDTAARLRRHGIEVGMFIMLGYDGEQMADLRATVDHLKHTSPDVFLTTVSYPIKGTPYYDQVADRLAPQAWTDGTDRDLVVRGRPVRTYYDFARRWMTAEVAKDQHWRRGRYAQAARSASSALVGRIGMAVTANWRER
jgi:anaerobic magnesium-protoporphyrin IX monomethyl ester cyclase